MNTALPGVSVMNTPVADGDKVRVTLKGGAGFDAPWITIDAPSVADAVAQLSRKDEVKALADAAAKAGAYFAATGKAATSGAAPKRFENGKVTPAPNPAADTGAYTCNHGQRNFKDGGAWAAYFCGGRGLDKSEQCPPLWRQADGSFRAK
ncbi:hypothetical protein ABZ951_04250 [Streptomyces sp. NPDC046215]